MAAVIEFDLMIDWISNDLWLKHYSAQIFLTVRWISHCFAFIKTDYHFTTDDDVKT